MFVVILVCIAQSVRYININLSLERVSALDEGSAPSWFFLHSSSRLIQLNFAILNEFDRSLFIYAYIRVVIVNDCRLSILFF